MKNPWLSYTIARLAMFFGIFLGLALLNFNPYFAAFIAAVASFALSLVFLDKQRKQLSERVHKKMSRDESGNYEDGESDLENRLLDESIPDEDKPETK